MRRRYRFGRRSEITVIDPTEIAVLQAAERPALAWLQNFHHCAVQYLALLFAQPGRLALETGQIGRHDHSARRHRPQHLNSLCVPVDFGQPFS